MRISVAMCTYNGARFLREQLDSIGAQSLPPDELVVCDDGSSDETTGIIREFAQSASFAVRLVVNEEKLGPARNFEKALTLCQGDLIAFGDQDDYWYPEKLKRLSRVMEGNETLGGIFSDADLMDEASKQSGSRLWERVQFRSPEHTVHAEGFLASRLLKGDVVTGATLMIRAAVRDLILPIPEAWMHDGWIAWMLVLYSGIAAVNEPLIRYRVHNAQHAGVSPGTLMGRIGYARRTGRANCLPTLRQFEELRAHWIAHPGRYFQVHLDQIEQKIAYLHYRMNLPSNFLKRLFQVTFAYDRYRRYANGSATMWKDILVN